MTIFGQYDQRKAVFICRSDIMNPQLTLRTKYFHLQLTKLFYFQRLQ